jgi:hypothetical protein
LRSSYIFHLTNENFKIRISNSVIIAHTLNTNPLTLTYLFSFINLQILYGTSETMAKSYFQYSSPKAQPHSFFAANDEVNYIKYKLCADCGVFDGVRMLLDKPACWQPSASPPFWACDFVISPELVIYNQDTKT